MNVLKLVYLNVVFYLLFILFSAISIPLLSLFVAFLSLFLSHRNTMKRFRRAISFYGAVIIRILPFPLIRVLYKDYSKDKGRGKGPYIFVCNHRSSSDPFLIACLPYEIVQIVNTWPFRLPVLGVFAKWAGYLNVKRMQFKEFSSKTIELLEQGVSIVAFPEGTRSRNKKVGQFHSSMFRVALQSRYPIVPVCISGNENKPPRGSLLLHQGIINMHKLPALQWEQYKDLGPFKLKNKIRDIIIKELAVMEGEA